MTQAPAHPPTNKETIERLAQHEKNIRNQIKGFRNGAAAMFSYCYMAGREMLLAKDLLPHGNSGDRNLGLKQWIEGRFGNFQYRTATNWMWFADAVHASRSAQSLFAKHPKLLSSTRLSVKERATILEVVRLVMDGKSMTRFTRDSRLLADPEKAQHHKRKPVDPEKARAAKARLAEKHWDRVRSDQALGEKLLQLLSAEILRTILDRNLLTNDKIRLLLKSEPKAQP